ncbi:hypothetical protein A2U01_0043787, partial [Trifolium medium]|nr:hypothetical protein [Trifolium medium]
MMSGVRGIWEEERIFRLPMQNSKFTSWRNAPSKSVQRAETRATLHFLRFQRCNAPASCAPCATTRDFPSLFSKSTAQCVSTCARVRGFSSSCKINGTTRHVPALLAQRPE